MFEGGNAARPVVIGFMAAPPTARRLHDVDAGAGIETRVDDERVVLSAKNEIVLQCGDASITLSRDGKVLIRGNYVLTRSAGVNRIQGGSVQIN